MMKRTDTFRKRSATRLDFTLRHVLKRHWVWLPVGNALELEAAALNRFVASRLYLVDWRIVVTRWQLVLQDTVERIVTASDWLESKIDGHSRSKRSWSGYV